MTLEEIANEIWNWERWEGVSGIWYARRRLSSPPIVLWATNQNELNMIVRDYLSICDPYTCRPLQGPTPIGADLVEISNRPLAPVPDGRNDD